MSSQNDPFERAEVIRQCGRIIASFRHFLRRDLLTTAVDAPPEAQARALYFAPFVVVSHGTEADPVLNFGNQAALNLWEMDWAALTSTPSRLTAEPVERAERARLMAEVTRNGYIDNYRGVRISRTGKRFRIERAIVWNLLDEHGAACGQAATFDNWQTL